MQSWHATCNIYIQLQNVPRDTRKTMKAFQVGQIVQVNTKHYGAQVGEIIEVLPNVEWPQKSEYIIKPHSHPRNIIALLQNVKAVC